MKEEKKEDGKNEDQEDEEGEAEEEEEEEEAGAGKGKKRKAGGGGFQSPLVLSDRLAEFVGYPALGRTTVVKLLWRYFRVSWFVSA